MAHEPEPRGIGNLLVRGALGRALPLALLLLLTASLGAAMTVDGRLSSASFISETFPPDQVREWDLINRLSLNVRELGHPALSLHWFGTHRGEILELGLDKSRARSYHGYLRAKPWRGLDLALGRQWVYGGVGSGRLDGLRLTLVHAELGSLLLFGGTRGFLAPDSDSVEGFDSDAFDESGLWGAQIRSKTLPGELNVALSAARLYRGGEEEGNRLGVGIDWRPRPRSLVRYEHRYELSAEESYHQHLRLFQRMEKGSFSIAWNRRQSFAPASESSYILQRFRDESWFSHAFDQRTDEIRAHYNRPCMILPSWELRLELLEIFPQDEDRGDGFSISWAKGGYALGYRLQRGFGGEQDGLFGEARYEFKKNTWAWIELNKVYYRYGEDDELDDEYVTDDESLATRLGFDALWGAVDGTLALEYLNNRRADSQVRLLFRLGYRFSHATQTGEE